MCGSSKTACAPYKRTEKGRCRNVLRRPFFALKTGDCQGSDLSPEPREIFEAPMRSVSCAGRRQLLLAGLEVQFIAAQRILGDGDDGRFTVFALGTLNTLLALFTGIALLALGTLNTLLSLRSRTAAVALHTLWTDLALNMQEDKEAVFDCVDTIKMCLRVFTPMIAAMKACTCNMYRAAQRGFLNATDLADYLTKKGLPFRAAYKIAGQLVAYCIEHTAVLEELPLALLRQYSERFGEDVYAAIALTSCVTGRTSLGGTCVASVEAQIASVRDFLAGQTEAAKQAENG